MGIVSHDYQIFGFSSKRRPDVSGGVLTLSVVPKAPDRAYGEFPDTKSVISEQVSAKRGVRGLLGGLFTKKPGEIKLEINVDGRTDFPNGAYKICGLTEFGNELHNVEIFVSANSAESDYIKLTQCLPHITLKLPNAKIG